MESRAESCTLFNTIVREEDNYTNIITLEHDTRETYQLVIILKIKKAFSVRVKKLNLLSELNLKQLELCCILKILNTAIIVKLELRT